MWSMVWQLLALPGEQTVTLTNGMFRAPGTRSGGPASTVIVATLSTADIAGTV
jgi:hypothetical protein